MNDLRGKKIIVTGGAGSIGHATACVLAEKGADVLLCPCHAGKFDLEGNVISGPPPQPLPRLALKVEGNSLVIG